MKRCGRCGEEKERAEYPPNRAQRDGLQSYCTPCQRQYLAEYRAKHRDKALAYAKAYYRANRERWVLANAAYRARMTPEQIEAKRAYTRTWRQAHPDWVKALTRASNKVRYALKTGRLVRADACQWCGSGDRKIAGAHWDYDRPLDVVWLCYPCHTRWDAADPKLAKLGA